MTCQAYLEKFQNAVDVLEHCGGLIGQLPGLDSMVLHWKPTMVSIPTQQLPMKLSK
jgi:hypothetical protein